MSDNGLRERISKLANEIWSEIAHAVGTERADNIRDRILALAAVPASGAAEPALAAPEMTVPFTRQLTVIVQEDSSDEWAANDIERLKQPESGQIFQFAAPEMYFHELRLAVSKEPSLAEKIVVFARTPEGLKECGLKFEDELLWPVGFLQSTWEKESEIQKIRGHKPIAPPSAPAAGSELTPSVKVCYECGATESDEQREYDKDCQCGGVFRTLPEAKSPKLHWEYVGEELAIFWESPYGHGKEKIASFWWPCHPIEATKEVEHAFEQIAERLAPSPTPAPKPAPHHHRFHVTPEDVVKATYIGYFLPPASFVKLGRRQSN